jgi:hypothetical protein
MGHYASEMGGRSLQDDHNEKQAKALLDNTKSGAFYDAMRSLQHARDELRLTKKERRIVARALNLYFDGKEYV